MASLSKFRIFNEAFSKYLGSISAFSLHLRTPRTAYTNSVQPQDLSADEIDVARSVLERLSLPDHQEEAKPVPAVVLRKRRWSRLSRRSGVLAIKLGMSQLWTKEGNSVGVTLLQIVDNEVVRVRTRAKEGYYAVQVGAVDHPKIKNVPKAVLGQYSATGVEPKRFLQEFRVSHDALLPPGTRLDASHFIPGQFVDVCSKSIGKGFQGVMKRHGMKGMPASHGVTKTHRKMGATGGGQDPGRVWPGKKMPGRMGGRRTTHKCLKIYRINYKYGVLWVHGPVPGHTNSLVRVTDARRKSPPYNAPFPGHIPGSSEEDHMIPEELYSSEIHGPHESTIALPDKRKH